MTALGKMRAFLAAPVRRKALAAEACWELLHARIDTAYAPSHYTRHFGDLGRQTDAVDLTQEALALEIGVIVARVAEIMPFRAKCLQQVLAVRRMLARRSVPTTIFLALARDPAERVVPSDQSAAHAWIKAGSRIVNGDTEIEEYTVVGAFS